MNFKELMRLECKLGYINVSPRKAKGCKNYFSQGPAAVRDCRLQSHMHDIDSPSFCLLCLPVRLQQHCVEVEMIPLLLLW